MRKWLITVLVVVGLACLAAFAQIWLPWLLTHLVIATPLTQSITNGVQLGLLVMAGVAGYLGMRWILLERSAEEEDKTADEGAEAAGLESAGEEPVGEEPAGGYVTMYTKGGVRIITEGNVLEGAPEWEVANGEHFDRMICPGSSMSNLDLEKVQAFLERERVASLPELNDEGNLKERLSALGLLNEGVPTYGAILCFGRLPQAWVPSSVTHFIHWRGDDRQSKRYERRQFGGDLTAQFEACLAFVSSSLRREKREGNDIPVAGVKEALANALVHRDYASRTEYVEVELFSNRLEIGSPGRPPLQLEGEEDAPEGLRNPLVARIFGLYGHTEGSQAGLQRMMAAMEEAELPPPEFALVGEAETFRVTLMRPSGTASSPEATVDTVRLMAAYTPTPPELTHPVAMASTPTPVEMPAASRTTFTPMPMEISRVAAETPKDSAGYPLVETPAPIPAAVISTPFNLPADLPDFAGREDEIARLHRCLRPDGTLRSGRSRIARGGPVPTPRAESQHNTALVTITGMGGIGKTTLSVHVAHQLTNQGYYPDGQLYLNLKGTDAKPVSAEGALNSLLNALVGPDPSRPEDLEGLKRVWRSAIHGKQVLLVLDNAEAAVQVRPLLPASATCGVMVTSRRRFPLPGADMLDLGRLKAGEAREMLKGLVAGLGNRDADAIAKACAGLPLALRIAGNYLALNDDISPKEYATRLTDQRARLSVLRDPDDPDLDVAATLSLSVAQLGSGTRWAWSLLALFPGFFDSQAAAALWGEGVNDGRWQPLGEGATMERLRTLRNRSLVSYNPETGRYGQHDLLRLAAAKEMGRSQGKPAGHEIEAAQARVARHFLARAQAAALEQRYLDLDPEWPHLHSALEYAVEEDLPLLSDLAMALDDYWSVRGQARERVTWSRRAARACVDTGQRCEEGRHLGHTGQAYADLGNARRAIEYYGKALVTSRGAGDAEEESRHLGRLGEAYAALGDARRALLYYEQALELTMQVASVAGEANATLGTRQAEGLILGGLGNAYASLGDSQRAIAHHEQALAIARETDDRRSEGIHLGDLGASYSDIGDFQQAIQCHRDALAIHREVGNRRGEGNALDNLGRAYAGQAQTPRAIDYYEQALEIAQQIGDQRAEGAEMGNLGNAYADLGDSPRAIRHYERALAIAQEIGDRRHEGTWLGNLGRAYVEMGDVAQAMDTFEQALKIAQEIDDRRNEGTWLGNLGRAHSYLGELSEAIHCYERALDIHREVGDRRSEGTWLGNLGLLAQVQGDTERARQHWTEALSVFQALKDANAAQVMRWLAELEGEAVPAAFQPPTTARPPRVIRPREPEMREPAPI